jgi:hypothetical protein
MNMMQQQQQQPPPQQQQVVNRSGPGGMMLSGPGGRGLSGPGGMSSGPGARQIQPVGDPNAQNGGGGRQQQNPNVPRGPSGGDCKTCEQPIYGPLITVKDSKFHPDCFVCESCSQPFNGM